MHTPGGVVRWTYKALWGALGRGARALIACGVGKDSRFSEREADPIERDGPLQGRPAGASVPGFLCGVPSASRAPALI